MEQLGAYEAKTRLFELLERASRGERFLVTRHGKPVALLVPASGRRPAAEVIRELREFRRGRRLDGATLRHLLGEGRRF